MNIKKWVSALAISAVVGAPLVLPTTVSAHEVGKEGSKMIKTARRADADRRYVERPRKVGSRWAPPGHGHKHHYRGRGHGHKHHYRGRGHGHKHGHGHHEHRAERHYRRPARHHRHDRHRGGDRLRVHIGYDFHL